ncbi:MAG: hypothetical protein J2P35_11590, partial [Actinobacteria bacterium]|nr:hypothetical protein [Actinomycetota bacterium]
MGSRGRSTGSGNAGGGSRQRWAVLLGVAGVLAAGCSGTPNSITEPATAKAHAAANAKPAAAALPPKLTITPADRSTHISPQRDVRVAITHGKMEQVTLITAGSDPVSGTLNSAGTAWHSTAPLQPSRRYTVTATAAGPSGKPVTRTSSFRTLTPAATFSAQTLLGHQTYGVGMPIMLTFNHAVRNKAAVERSIELWSSKPVVGAWYWDGSKALDFRPRTYWPQHTRVRFVARLKGVEAAPGVYGTANLSQSFRIGNSLIAVVSTRTHYEKIYYRKKLLGHWPVSTGSPGDDTANGTYLTIEKGNPVLMSGPGYTNFPVP